MLQKTKTHGEPDMPNAPEGGASPEISEKAATARAQLAAFDAEEKARRIEKAVTDELAAAQKREAERDRYGCCGCCR